MQPPDWVEVLAALRLDERQLHYLKLLRDRHQDRMRAIISARQALSMEVRFRCHWQGLHELRRLAGQRAPRAMIDWGSTNPVAPGVSPPFIC